MSHVTEIDLEIRDLDALKKACEMLGLEFREGQKTYRWFGTHVGDYPLPKGFTKEEMGHCEHAIAIKNGNGASNGQLPYEVGVVTRRDGKQGYTLLWDFYCGGFGLQAKIGENGHALTDSYSAALSVQKLRRQGFRIQQTKTPQGKIVIRATR